MQNKIYVSYGNGAINYEKLSDSKLNLTWGELMYHDTKN